MDNPNNRKNIIKRLTPPPQKPSLTQSNKREGPVADINENYFHSFDNEKKIITISKRKVCFTVIIKGLSNKICVKR